METIHTHYIKKLADETGRTYRELETLWAKFKNEVENDRLYDPNKYSHITKQNGSISQEIDKKLRAYIENPEGVESEEIDAELNAVDATDLADEIESEMELDEEIPSDFEEGAIVDDFITSENAEWNPDDDDLSSLFPDETEGNVTEETVVEETPLEDSEMTETEKTPE